MKKSISAVSIAILLFFSTAAQNDSKISGKLKVFIDCNNTYCNMTFIRTEINIIDFMLDRLAADVHVLITEQNTGGGGSKFQLIFFGQNRFKTQQDTLSFNISPFNTDFEKRDLLVKYLKFGLLPYLAKTDAAKDIAIDFKKAESNSTQSDSTQQPIKDPWNYWVLRFGANGNFNADAVYKDRRYSGSFSANRTTEALKINFRFRASTSKSAFEYEDAGVTQKIIVNNHNIDFSHFLVKSINDHWSYGYETSLNQNSFSNNRGSAFFKTAFEYNIYPYSEVNNRYFSISYGITARHNRYYDSTIYDKLSETLFGHSADATISFVQKWGSTGLGINYHNYLHNWKLFNLGIRASTEVRITGGLSFNIYLYGALTRDQLNLPKGGATEQEILTRRKQIASGYSYFTSFGFSYRFGSKVNNFVNARFEGPDN